MALITIVGVGALGSHAALLLRGHELRVIDGDRVEAKNIGSQFHSSATLRRNKAQACANTLQMLFRVRVNAFCTMLHEDNVNVLLRGSDVVVDCCDNIAARTLIQRWCGDSIPCIHGCLSADGLYGRVVWNERFVPDPEGVAGQATCEDASNLPFHGLVGAVVARETIRCLDTGIRWNYEITSQPLQVKRIC